MTDLVAWLTKILDEDAQRYSRHEDDCESEYIPGKYPCDCVFGFLLADIAAKRAIIDEYVARDKDADLMLGPDCLRQQEWSGLRLAVQIIATGYAARPGYRDEWKPLSTRTHP